MVLQWVEQKGKEKRSAGEKLGWATAHSNTKSRHSRSCRDMGSWVCAGLARMSTQPGGRALLPTTRALGAHDMVWQDWYCDTLFGVVTWLAFMASRLIVGVATRRLQGEPFWCRDTLFGVATHSLVSQHGLVSLGSRPEKGCRDRPGR